MNRTSNKINRLGKMGKKLSAITIFVSASLITTSSMAEFILDSALSDRRNENSVKTGPLTGSKPYISKIKANGPASANKTDVFTLDFDPANNEYLFIDGDLDQDISKDNFTWYCFSDPAGLLSELETNYPADPAAYIADLVSKGEAIAFARVGDEKGIVDDTAVLKSTLTLTQYCAGGIGYAINAESKGGYPVESRLNTSIIVPSVDLTASQAADGKVTYTGTLVPIELIGTIEMAFESGSNGKQSVPPRDMNGKGNSKDNDPSAWPSIVFNVKAENANNEGSYIDVSGALPVWNITVTKPDATSEKFELSNKAKMDEFGITVKSGPEYDEQESRWSVEIASNQPIDAELTVNFTNGTFTNNEPNSSVGNKIGFSFYDQPSESIELKVYELGIDGTGIPRPIDAGMEILPDRIYGLEIVDPANLNSDNKPSVVTNYFNDYIRWSYKDVTGAVQAPIHIAGCDGTYQFPTQKDNETRVATEIKALAPNTLPNYEQGLSLIPSLDLPANIISGEAVLTAAPKADLVICTTK